MFPRNLRRTGGRSDTSARQRAVATQDSEVVKGDFERMTGVHLCAEQRAFKDALGLGGNVNRNVRKNGCKVRSRQSD